MLAKLIALVKKTKIDGRDRIAGVLAGFEETIADLQQGIKECAFEKSANEAVIRTLQYENHSLNTAANKADDLLRNIEHLLGE